MTAVTIYHNPRCSKSRQTLALLEQTDHQINVIEYLKQPLTIAEIEQLLVMLSFDSPRQLMRVKEAEYKEQNLEQASAIDLLTAMQQTPKLIERPIVVTNGKAAIGRPPEQVLDIL
ncbi:MAG: arsenate reductase (glutaredoxin) [Gammaproteobacteria bacterium]|nr:arsenate reductase (glutaredoxin) [Gammaproteobacteria bacterium]